MNKIHQIQFLFSVLPQTILWKLTMLPNRWKDLEKKQTACEASTSTSLSWDNGRQQDSSFAVNSTGRPHGTIYRKLLKCTLGVVHRANLCRITAQVKAIDRRVRVYLHSFLDSDLQEKLYSVWLLIQCHQIITIIIIITRCQSNFLKNAPRGPIPRLGVTPGGQMLYHWIPGVGFPISVP